MQWSKTKATLEAFLCDKLKGRIKIYATVYRKFHDEPSRVWITFDKKEILSAPDVTYYIKHEKLYEQIKEDNKLKPIPYNEDWNIMFESEERKNFVKASETAEGILVKQNIFSSYHLYTAFMRYGSLSINEAIYSDNIMIQAFSMLDRRLGKRRLVKLNFTDETHPLIVKFYKIRCSVEGIEPNI